MCFDHLRSINMKSANYICHHVPFLGVHFKCDKRERAIKCSRDAQTNQGNFHFTSVLLRLWPFARDSRKQMDRTKRKAKFNPRFRTFFSMRVLFYSLPSFQFISESFRILFTHFVLQKQRSNELFELKRFKCLDEIIILTKCIDSLIIRRSHWLIQSSTVAE